MYKIACEMILIHSLLDDLGITPLTPLWMYCDEQAKKFIFRNLSYCKGWRISRMSAIFLWQRSLQYHIHVPFRPIQSIVNIFIEKPQQHIKQYLVYQARNVSSLCFSLKGRVNGPPLSFSPIFPLPPILFSFYVLSHSPHSV